MEKTKIRAKDFIMYLLIFLLGGLLGFALSYSVCNILYEFDVISEEVFTSLVIIVTAVAGVAGIIIVRIDIESVKKRRLVHWVSMNYGKLIFFLVVFGAFSAFFKRRVYLSYAELKEILSVVWTIFGLALTVFLVWNVFLEYWKKKAPVMKQDMKGARDRYAFTQKKADFYSETKASFLNVILLLCSMMVLLITTTLVYVIEREASVLTQTLVMACLCLSSNALIGLFLDFLKPFWAERRMLLKSNYVSAKEFDNIISMMIVEGMLEVMEQTIYEDESLSQEEKKEKKEKLQEIRNLLSYPKDKKEDE